MILEFVADLLLEAVLYPLRRAVERVGDRILGRAKRLPGRASTAKSGGRGGGDGTDGGRGGGDGTDDGGDVAEP